MKNINKILKQQIESIKPDVNTLKEINKTVDEFSKHLQKMLKGKKIKADVFIGGSLAKGTLTKKKKYDVDVFVRFNKKYKDKEISKLLRKIVGKAKRIHGSRDYYKINVKGIIFEIIPVLKIKKPGQAANITDLSYFHVNYIQKKINKNKKFADEILLAKTFCYAQNCYGAESYIHGFSGYSLELLICYYKSFLRFIKEILSLALQNTSEKKRRLSDNKITIDSEKKYKNKEEILRELNESKLNSPIILIDPTFKERNALAGLSKETFLKFQKACKSFLSKPSQTFFVKKDIGDELRRKYKDKLKVIKIKTTKQAGDISGTKGKKFFEFFLYKLKREFQIQLSEFDYNEKENIAFFYIIVEKKKDEIIKGPPVTAVHNLSSFKKAHPKAFIKNHFAYAKIYHKLSFEQFVKRFKSKEKKIIEQMSIKKVELMI